MAEGLFEGSLYENGRQISWVTSQYEFFNELHTATSK